MPRTSVTTFRKTLQLLSLLPAFAVAMTFPAAVVETGSWQQATTAFARVSARQQANLELPFKARIVELAAKPGARVEAGDPLLRFDAPLLRRHIIAWQQGVAEVQLAQKQLNVLRESESQHVITRRDRVDGEAALARAKGIERMHWETLAGDLDVLNTKVDADKLQTRIASDGVASVAKALGSLGAPFAGVVTDLPVALGELIQPGTTVIELESLQQVYLDVGVPEAALPIWKSGETHVSDGTGSVQVKRLKGAALYDKGSGLWLVRYQAENPEQRLRDGAWVQVEHLAEPVAVVWVPQAAVVARNGKTWCVRKVGDQFKPVAVKVGSAAKGRIPVVSGLAAGDTVVTEGAYELLYRDLKELIKFVD